MLTTVATSAPALSRSPGPRQCVPPALLGRRLAGDDRVGDDVVVVLHLRLLHRRLRLGHGEVEGPRIEGHEGLPPRHALAGNDENLVHRAHGLRAQRGDGVGANLGGGGNGEDEVAFAHRLADDRQREGGGRGRRRVGRRLGAGVLVLAGGDGRK